MALIGAADRGQQVVLRHHGGMDPGLDMVAVVAADGQQFDPAAELARQFDIHGLDPGNAFGGDLVVGDRRAIGDGHQNGKFMGGIDAFDIVGGIGLGKPELLGILEHLGKGDALIGHPGKDVIGGAVHDPHDRENLIGNQPFLQGLDHRDAAADAGLEADLHPLPGRCRKDVGAFLGKQGLVGGDHMLAGGYRLHDKGLGRFDAADQLDDDIDFRVIDQLHGVPGQGRCH